MAYSCQINREPFNATSYMDSVYSDIQQGPRCWPSQRVYSHCGTRFQTAVRHASPRVGQRDMSPSILSVCTTALATAPIMASVTASTTKTSDTIGQYVRLVFFFFFFSWWHTFSLAHYAAPLYSV